MFLWSSGPLTRHSEWGSVQLRNARHKVPTSATCVPPRQHKTNTNIFLLLLKQVAVIVFSDILQSSFLYIRLPVLHGELLFRYRDHVKLLAGQLSKLWSDVNSSVICFEIRPFSVSLKKYVRSRYFQLHCVCVCFLRRYHAMLRCRENDTAWDKHCVICCITSFNLCYEK